MLGRSLVLVMLASGLAAAQPKEPTKAQKDKITELTKKAIDRSKNGDHEGAIKDLKDAYDIAPDAAAVLLSNIGYEYKHLKQPAEAWKYFCMYLEKEPGGSASSYVLTEAKTLHAELKYEGDTCAKQVEKPPPPVPDPKPNPDPAPPPVPEQPKQPGRTLKLAGIGVAGAGAIVLGAGVVFGLKAKGNADDITGGPPIDEMTGMQLSWGPHPEAGWPGISKLESDLSSNKTKFFVLTGVGAAMVATGVVLYVKGNGKKNTEATIAPAGPGGPGVTLIGSF